MDCADKTESPADNNVLPPCKTFISTQNGQIQIFDDEKTWHAAEADCSSRRTHLADLHYKNLIKTAVDNLLNCQSEHYPIYRQKLQWQIGLTLKNNKGIWSDGDRYDIKDHIAINSSDGGVGVQYVRLDTSTRQLVSNSSADTKLPYLCTELPNKGLAVIMSVFGVICLLMIPILLLKIFYRPPKKKPLDVEHYYASDDSLSDFPKPLFDDDDDDFYQQHKMENEVAANDGGAQQNKPAEASQQDKPVAAEASHKTLNSHSKHETVKSKITLDHAGKTTTDHAGKTTTDHAKLEH